MPPLKIRAAVLVLVSVLGCNDSTGPFSNLSATNNADDFVFIAQTFGRTATTTLHYTWPNTGNVGLVTLGNDALGGGTLAPIQGTASLTIHDAAGAQVYSHDLKASATDTTSSGMPGDWTIDLAFSNVNGDIVFELKKAPRDLTVSTATTGANKDADGYTASLDVSSQAIGPDGVITFGAVSPGNHNLVLSGVAANCTVSGGNTRTLSVPAGVPTGVAFSISCI